MTHYPDFVDHEIVDYQSDIDDDESTRRERDSRGNSNQRESSDNVPIAQPSSVFDQEQLKISVTEFESDEEYDEVPEVHEFVPEVHEFVPEVHEYDYDFSRGYQREDEYELDDWESHRGGESEIRRIKSSQKLRSVESSFDDDDLQVDKRPSCLLIFTICILCLELGAAMIAVIFFEPLVECCGESFVSPSETTTETWNKALYGISVGYLVWIILDFPIVALSKEPVFLFNPMIGFLLCMHMLYVTNTTYAFAIYGLETAAMLGQSYVLMQLQRNAELCVHSIFNFIMCGIVIYALIELTRQGGYCIVGGSLQGVFTDSTCDVRCNDEASCNNCAGNATQCFIPFQSSI
ncbi:hypothetical protein IV203_016903 [Nitzschia inconspicua]|uniref:Uncharacterized protein n=1 Tax=Nitzschia inconspicua TaxID=303405 RepID=A0A9K3KSD6_9STRA|nr:hypothetical protein IV203_016903 [Nitzschia inconspicua]